MSLHYEFVLACDLKPHTPIEFLNVLRWHLGIAHRRPAGLPEQAHPLFKPSPESPLPGGEFAALTDNGRGWGLFYRGFWIDDAFYDEITDILALLAPHVMDGYAGHFREELAIVPTTISFQDGVPAFVPER